jgi:hypothetical protein
VGESPWGTETFAVTGQPTKSLTSPTDPGSTSINTDTTPPVLANYPGLFINSDGVYQAKYSAAIRADVNNLFGYNSSISAFKTFNDGSKVAAAKYGAKSDKYMQWLNMTLPSVYGPNSASSVSGGDQGLTNPLTSLTLKDLYIIIGVVLVGILAIILIARAIKPAAQAVAPLAALAV